MACSDFKPPYFKCETHSERVQRDVKELSVKTGINFEVFINFMLNSPDYVVEGFPDMLKADGFEFDYALRSSSDSEIIYAINSSTKESGLIRKIHYNNAVETWRVEAEKAIWRDRLRSVGVDVKW